MPELKLPNGSTLFYSITDKAKPPLLLLHCWAVGDSNIWAKQKTYFSDTFNVITPDFRGHGQSGKDRSLGLGVFAQDIHELIKQLGISNINIAGHSMGALVLMQYIKDFGTDQFKTVCFIDQSPKLLTDKTWSLGVYGNFDEATNNRFVNGLQLNFEATMSSFGQNGLKDDLEERARSYKAPPIFPPHIRPEIIIDIWHTMIRCDFRDTVAAINVPTFLAYGKNSQFYPTEVAAYMHSHIAKSELVIFENSSHSPAFEEPDKFNHLYRQFLTR
jgi:pimeloyl-ACP methyl ester carboxylesterase